MKYNVLFLVIIFCHLSCKQNTQSDHVGERVVSPSSSGPSQEEINQLLGSAINEGNERAYNRVAAHYLINQRHEDFFYYAFIMAAKYKNAEAYFHLYLIMGGRDAGTIKSVDELEVDTRNIALYCLLRSYELNDPGAKSLVEELFQKAIPSSQSYGQGICEELK